MKKEIHPDYHTITVQMTDGSTYEFGGYDWKPELAKYYEGLPEWRSMCQPTVEGDNLLLGGECGAALAGVPSYNLGMFFGYRIPGEEHEGKPMYRASWEGGHLDPGPGNHEGSARHREHVETCLGLHGGARSVLLCWPGDLPPPLRVLRTDQYRLLR